MDPIIYALNYNQAQAALKDAETCNTDAATCEMRRADSYCIEDEERREREEYAAYVARKEAAERYPEPKDYPDPTGFFAACGNYNPEV